MTGETDCGAVEDGDSTVTASGWCAPTVVTHDALSPSLNEVAVAGIGPSLPEIRAFRPGTPAWEQRQREIEHMRIEEEVIQRYVARVIGDIVLAQELVLSWAYASAAGLGMDVLVEEPPAHHTTWRWTTSGSLAAYRFIGIQLVERADTHERRLQGNRPIIIRRRATDTTWWDD